MFYKVFHLIICIICLLMLIWIPVFIWIRGHSRELIKEVHLSCEARGEGILIKPQICLYSGADFKYSRIKGNGVICVTEKRIIFKKLFGKAIEIDLSDIQDVTEQKWFKGKPAFATGAQYHLIIHTKDSNRIGFLMKNSAVLKKKLSPRKGA